MRYLKQRLLAPTPSLFLAATLFSRQFVFSIRFSDCLGAWNRLLHLGPEDTLVTILLRLMLVYWLLQ